MTSRIVELRATGLSQQAVGDAVGVAEFSVRWALKLAAEQAIQKALEAPAAPAPGGPEIPMLVVEGQPELPIQPAPVPRAAERTEYLTTNHLMDCIGQESDRRPLG